MAPFPRLLLYLAGLGFLIFIIFGTPIRYSIPQIIQAGFYKFDVKSRIDEAYANPQDLRDDKLYCNKNADCYMLTCGQAPNCNSQVANVYHQILQCGQIDCAEELDAYVACKDHQCIYGRLLKPSL